MSPEHAESTSPPQRHTIPAPNAPRSREGQRSTHEMHWVTTRGPTERIEAPRDARRTMSPHDGHCAHIRYHREPRPSDARTNARPELSPTSRSAMPREPPRPCQGRPTRIAPNTQPATRGLVLRSAGYHAPSRRLSNPNADSAQVTEMPIAHAKAAPSSRLPNPKHQDAREGRYAKGVLSP